MENGGSPGGSYLGLLVSSSFESPDWPLRIASLKFLMPSPRPLPSCGILPAPKMSTTITRMTRSSGRPRLGGEGRLSDQLNRTPDLLIRDARLEGLDDGQLVDMSEVTIARDELCAVVVSGPRGDVARRLHTRTTHVEVEAGPYLVEGWVHGTPASEPLAVFLRQMGGGAPTAATAGNAGVACR